MSEALRDESIEDLREHLGQWWKDKVSTSAGGDLRDQNYQIVVIKDLIQDINELFNITLGILDRLNEAHPKSTKEGKIDGNT